MFNGQAVESGEVKQILTNPKHEYTKSLIAAVPRGDRKVERFKSIDYIEGGAQTQRRIDLDHHWLGKKFIQHFSDTAISINDLNKKYSLKKAY